MIGLMRTDRHLYTLQSCQNPQKDSIWNMSTVFISVSHSQNFKGCIVFSPDIKCGRKKATALVKSLAKGHQQRLTVRMQTAAFTLSTDGSNDDKSKTVPTGYQVSRPRHRTCELWTALPSSMHWLCCREKHLSAFRWRTVCTELAVGQLSCTRHRQCASHDWLQERCDFFHWEEATKCLLQVLGWMLPALGEHCCTKGTSCLPDIAEILTDMYYYFQKSEKRQHDFSEMQELYDTDQKRMLKHVATRWLSIGCCIERLLKNGFPLKSFFKAQKTAQ